MKTSILALAIALALSFTAAPAAAGLSNQDKCDAAKLLAAAKFSQCHIKVEFLALRKGAKLTEVKKEELQAKCETKLTDAYAKVEDKYPSTTSDGDHECSRYGDGDNMIQALKAAGDAVADGSASTLGSNALDPTSDNPSVCVAAGGTWVLESDTCAPGSSSSYNCAIGAICSSWHAEYPELVGTYTNPYGGHFPGDGPASECEFEDWIEILDDNPDFGFGITGGEAVCEQ